MEVYPSERDIPAYQSRKWVSWVYGAALAAVAVFMAINIMRLAPKYTILGIITLAGIALVFWKLISTGSVIALLLLLHIVLALAAAPRSDLKLLTGVVAIATIAVALFGLMDSGVDIINVLTYGALILWSIYLIIVIAL